MFYHYPHLKHASQKSCTLTFSWTKISIQWNSCVLGLTRILFSKYKWIYWYGSTYEQCSSTVKTFYITWKKTINYKPELLYGDFKKPKMYLEYATNEAEMYEKVEISEKL